jgi:hypothetical protein
MTTESGWTVPMRLLEDAAKLVGHSVSEIIPPEAQIHLLGAQRELLLALAITIEHNSSRGDASVDDLDFDAEPEDGAPRARGKRARAAGASRTATAKSAKRAARRPTKVAID